MGTIPMPIVHECNPTDEDETDPELSEGNDNFHVSSLFHMFISSIQMKVTKRWMISFRSGSIVDNNNFRWIRRFEDPATGRPGWNCQRKHCQRHNGSKALSPYTLLSFLSQSTSFKLQLGLFGKGLEKHVISLTNPCKNFNIST